MNLNDNVLRREIEIAAFLPYTSLVTSSVVKLGDIGAYLFCVELQGHPAGSADAIDINHWHTQVKQLTRQIADPRVALHAHTIQDEVRDFPAGAFSNRFAREYNDKYRAMLAGRKMHAARLFLTVLYQPRPATPKLLARFGADAEGGAAMQQTDDLRAVADLIDTVLAGLHLCQPVLLECYERNRTMYSRTLELLGRLLNGVWQPAMVPRAEVRDMLADARITFGNGGLMAHKRATGIDYGAVLGIKEYATPTFPGRLDAMLAQGYPWVLSQSFTYIDKIVAQKLMVEQRNRLDKAADLALRQVAAIDDALDALMANEIAMGDHELSLHVSAPDEKTLNERIAAAGVVLSGTDMKWLREDVGLGSAFLAMMPGNLRYRIDPQMISNNNFAGLIGTHNIPAGRRDGAQWGPAVTLFESDAGTPVFFNWHQPDPDPAARFDPNHKEPATTLLIGGTGTGKTTLIGHLLTQSQKFAEFPANFPGIPKLSCAVFDKDRGLAIAVPALGGHYYCIKTGVPTGLAPFQMEPTAATLAFLDQLVTRLAWHPDLPLSLRQASQITDAIAGVMLTDRPLRRLGALLEFFDANEADGLHARLAPWCAGGKHGWLFDNPVDAIALDFPVVGFDVTDFLLLPEISTPLMMYLLHRVDSLLDGRRVPIFIDEAPTLLADPVFAGYVERALVQIRKKDGFLVLAAQYPRQILDSPLAAALVSQPATMIFLADKKADRNDLVRGFKLTDSEVELIRGLGKRQALLCQGGNSTVIDLTLTGFEDEIAVLSGNTATSSLCGRLIDQYGADPQHWLAHFHRQRKGIPVVQ